MKNVLTLALLFVSTISMAQLEVQEHQKSKTLYKNVYNQKLEEFYHEDSTTYYAFYFRDAQYSRIVEIKYLSFNNKDEAIQFFKLALTTFLEDKEYSVKLDGETVFLKKKMLGTYIYKGSAYFAMTKKNLEDIILVLEQ